MSVIDIRQKIAPPVHTIKFADLKAQWYTVTHIRKAQESVLIQTERSLTNTMALHSAEHAQHMIDAIQHAMNLGWFDNLK